MSNEDAQVTDITNEVNEAVVRLLHQVIEDAPNLQAVMIGYVRKDGAAAVRYSPMSTAMLSHLSRIFDLKIDREYMGSMFPQHASPVRPPSAQGKSYLSQAVRSHLQSTAAIAPKEEPSPAERVLEREKARNRAKTRKTADKS